jgi:hypothetical protein
MTKDQKVIRAKVGLLELARQLGNVSQACRMMGYSRFLQNLACRIHNAEMRDLQRNIDTSILTHGGLPRCLAQPNH